jgi:predicted transcriptional regulator of viral defense system
MRGLRAIEIEVQELAARQHGVVARRQLTALGLGEDAIDHRLASGRLVRLHRGVYALGHAELRREGRALAVVLTAGPGAVLSHRSAAAHWGLRPWGGSFVELTAPGRAGIRRRPGRFVHRSASLSPAEATIERGVPVTTVPRTLLDLAAVVPAHHLRRAVARWPRSWPTSVSTARP